VPLCAIYTACVCHCMHVFDTAVALYIYSSSLDEHNLNKKSIKINQFAGNSNSYIGR